MSAAVLVARAGLALVFGMAGWAKLEDVRASQATIAGFGVRWRVARVAGVVLPIVELGTALALLPQQSARWASAVAVLLLLTFIGGIAYALSHGRTPDCNCFGQVLSSQISWRTLARNAILLAIAGLVVWRAPGWSLSDWTRSLGAANLVAGVAVLAALAGAVVALRYRRLAEAGAQASTAARAGTTPGLATGEAAPDFELESLTGELVTLNALRGHGRPVVLVFASPVCGPCIGLLPELARWRVALGESITFALVESGVREREAIAEQLSGSGDIIAVIEDGREIAGAYHVSATPTAVAVDPDGRIALPYAVGAPAIEQLVRAVLRGSAPLLAPAA